MFSLIAGLKVNADQSCSYPDSYPYPSADYNQADRWLFFFRECTSYVAWKMNKDAGTTAEPYFFSNYMRGGHFGDAGGWATNAAAIGFVTNNVPTVGAIAHWGYGELGALGHVAYVEAVNPNGSVDVSEYNYHLDHNFDLRCGVNPPRFIHINDSEDSIASFGGTVTDRQTDAPLSGATVTWGAWRRITDGLGRYDFNFVPCGTRTLTVAKPGFANNSDSYSPICLSSSVKNVSLATEGVPNLITWTGAAGDGNWFNSVNWSPGTVPTATDTVVVNAGNVTVPPNASFAVFNLNGGTLNGTFTIASTMNWFAGNVDAQVTVASGGVFNLTGSALKQLGGTLLNAGTVTLAAGSSLTAAPFNANVAFTNLATGILELHDGSELRGQSGGFGSGPFPKGDNAGLVRVLAGTGTAQLNVSDFVNTGTVDVQSGTLGLGARVISNGTFTGAGTVLLAGEINGTLVGQHFQVINAARVTGAFTLAGQLDWLDGIVDAQITVASGGLLNLGGSALKQLGGTLLNAGTVSLAAGNSLTAAPLNANVAFTNLATGILELHDGSEIRGGSGGAFFGPFPKGDNAGLVRVLAATGTAQLNVSDFVNTGTVDVQSGTLRFTLGYRQTSGTTILSGGALAANMPIFIDAGMLSGTGSITATVVNAGEIRPGVSPGILTINGD